MRDRLPVYVENRELPRDEFRNKSDENNDSYGYVNVLFLASLITTIASIITISILIR